MTETPVEPRSRVWIPLGLIAAWVGYTFWPILDGSHLYFWNDISHQNLPFHKVCVDAMSHGAIPHWSDGLQAGFPLLAEGQCGFFYPPHLLLRSTLDWVVAFNLVYPIHWLIGATGMWTLCRLHGRRGLPASVAAASFVFGGYWITRVVHTNNLEVAAWLPWGLVLTEKAMRSRGVVWWMLLAALVAVQHFAGYPQIIIISVATYAIVFLWRLVGLRARLRVGQACARVALFLLAIGLGTGLAAVQLLPSKALIAESERASGVADAYAASVSLPPRAILLLAFPNAYGWQNAFGNVDFGGLGSDAYWEYAIYVGWLPLVCAMLAAARITREPDALLWLVVVVIGFAIAIGPATPLWRLWRQLPVLGLMRGWARFSLMMLVGLCMLAAIGLDRLLSMQHPRRVLAILTFLAVAATSSLIVLASGNPWWGEHLAKGLSSGHVVMPLVFGALALAALWAVAIRPRSLWPQLACFAVLCADLTVFGFALNPEFPRDTVLAQPESVSAILTGRPVGRCISFDRRSPHRDVVADNNMLAANRNLLWAIPSAEINTPLASKRYADLRASWADPAKAHEALPMLRALDVGFITTNVPEAHNVLLGAGCKPVLVKQTWTLLKSLPSYGQAWLVGRASVVDPAEMLAALKRPGLDLGRVALIESPLSHPLSKNLPNGSIEWHARSPELKALTVQTHEACLLVLSTSWHPYWAASLDGNPARLRRVNHLLMGVEIPAGEHRVELVYVPKAFRAGLWVSGVSGTVWVLAIVTGLLWRRRSAEHASPT